MKFFAILLATFATLAHAATIEIADPPGIYADVLEKGIADVNNRYSHPVVNHRVSMAITWLCIVVFWSFPVQALMAIWSGVK